MKIKILGTLGAALLSGALAGSADNSLVIGTTQEPAAMGEPFVNNQAIHSEITSWMFSDLTRIDLQGNPVPELATEVPTEKNGRVKITRVNGKPTEMTVRWTLRPGIRWSDGRPITTTDMKLSYDIYGNPIIPSAVRNNRPVKFKTIDQSNFELTYKPINLFYQYPTEIKLTQPGFVLPAHVIKPIWDKVQAKMKGKSAEEQRNIIQTDFLGAPIFTSKGPAPVSSGPFRIEKWIPGQSVSMVRNPNYWQKNTNNGVQRVVYRFFKDSNTLLTNVLSGSVDAVSSVGIANSPETLKTLRDQAKDYDIGLVTGSIMENVHVNQFSDVQSVKDMMLDDVRTRQALLYAIDRKTLATEVLGGVVIPTNSFVAQSSPLYNGANANLYPYDPEKAKQILAGLGWKAGSDGVLQRTAGGRTIRFELEYATTAGNPIRERNQQFILDNLKKVGIAVKINNSPAAVLFDDPYLQHGCDGTWKGLIEFAWVGNPITEQAETWYGDNPDNDVPMDNIPCKNNNYQGQVVSGWFNKEFNDLWNQSRSELDPAKRKQLFAQMQDVFIKDVATLPLYQRLELYVAKKDLANFVWNGVTRYPGAFAGHLVGWTSRGSKEIYKQPQR